MSETIRSGDRATAERESGRARDDADALARLAIERGREQVEQAKEKVADQAEEIADAVEATAEELASADGGGTVSGYGRSLAAMMRQLAGGLRERDVDAFASELAAFARRNPGAFLAGSVALGFGLSRFLKASGHRREPYGGELDDELDHNANVDTGLGDGIEPDDEEESTSDELAAFSARATAADERPAGPASSREAP